MSIAKTFLKQLNFDIPLPNLTIIDKDLISINTRNDDALALIFASFNFIEKNKIIKCPVVPNSSKKICKLNFDLIYGKQKKK